MNNFICSECGTKYSSPEFYLATQQVPKGAPPLIFECWLTDNYYPPTNIK